MLKKAVIIGHATGRATPFDSPYSFAQQCSPVLQRVVLLQKLLTATGINWTKLAVLLALAQAKAAAPSRTYSVHDWLYSAHCAAKFGWHPNLECHASVVLPSKKGRRNTTQSSAVK